MKSAARTRGQYKYNKSQVIFLTRMSEEQYNNFQIDTAKAWTERYWQSIMDTELLLSTILFWKWWMNTWCEADDRIVLKHLYAVPKSKRYSAYREMHQYVFDTDNHYQQFMMADFRSLRSEFEKEMKKPTLV